MWTFKSFYRNKISVMICIKDIGPKLNLNVQFLKQNKSVSFLWVVLNSLEIEKIYIYFFFKWLNYNLILKTFSLLIYFSISEVFYQSFINDKRYKCIYLKSIYVLAST